MQIPSRPIVRLLRRPNGAPSPAPMHRISPSSRSLLSSMAPRGWLPTLAQRVALVRAALNPPVRHFSRFSHGSRKRAISSTVKGKELSQPDRRRLIPSSKDPIHTTKDNKIFVDKHFPISRRMDNEENRAAIEEFIARYGNAIPANNDDGSKISMEVTRGKQDPMEVTRGKQDTKGAAKDVGDGEDEREQAVSKVSDHTAYGEFTDCQDTYPRDGSVRWRALRKSSHRDGSIYCTRGTFGSGWKNEFRIADRNETQLEAMMLSDPNKDCIVEDGTCVWHRAHSMLQIFSVKLAKTSVVDGPVQLYGYIAARDLEDPLLNYIVNISRDDPITVEKGSLIEMTGPKRGIDLSCDVLIEYDMRIKTGEQEKGDLQLIDGVSIVDGLLTSSNPLRNRIYGDCGAIDITRMCIDYAFEATVEVVISEVQSSFELLLSCFTSGLHEEIRLFDGVIGESRGLRRHVLAVRKGRCMDLKFKVGFGSDCCAEHCHSFEATNHGCSSEQIKMEFALVSVKVTWSSLEYWNVL